MNFFPINSIKNLLEILDQNTPNPPPFFNFLCIILYFTQILSYLFKITPQNTIFKAFSLCFQYSSLSNILLFISNYNIFFVIYLTIVFTLYFTLFMQFIFIFSKKKHKKSNFFKVFYSYFISFHPWILLLPFNDIFLLIFDESLFFKPNIIFYVISLTGISFNTAFGLFSLWVKKSLKFNEQGLILDIRVSGLFSFIIRLSLGFLALLLTDKALKIGYYLLLNGFFLLNVINIINEFAIRNKKLCSWYYSSLIGYETIVITMFFYDFTGVLLDFELFFIGTILLILAVKLGGKFFDYRYKGMIYRDLSLCKDIIYYLEEIQDLSLYNHKGKFIYKGTFKTHFKTCRDPNCVLLEKRLYNGNYNEKYIMNQFILLKFKKILITSGKKLDKLAFFINNFIRYLLLVEMNPIKSYLEIQKITYIYKITNNSSFFNRISIEILKKKMISRIKKLSVLEKPIENDRKTVKVDVFFKIMKKQSNYEKTMKSLILLKKAFWEDYELGIDKTSDLIDKLTVITIKIDNFHCKLLKTTKDPNIHLINLKYLSILHSVLYNSINLAYRYEDEYNNLMKRDISNEKTLKCFSFLDSNIIVLMTSLLNNEGKLLEIEENDKIPLFFGYSPLEFTSIKLLPQLMPDYIGKNHSNFIRNSFRSVKQEKKDLFVESFAKDKKGFVFAVKIYKGFNFDYKDDFIIIAALLKEENIESFDVLTDGNGEIIGFSKDFIEIFNEFYGEIDKELIYLLSLEMLVPEAKIPLENSRKETKNVGGKEKFNDMGGFLYLPKNFKRILEVIRDFKKEMEKEEIFLHDKSLKTLNTNFSNKINAYLKRNCGFLPTIEENEENIKGNIYKNMIKETQMSKYPISFDFITQKHCFDSEKNQFIIINHLKIKKIKKPQGTELNNLICLYKTVEINDNHQKTLFSEIIMKKDEVEQEDPIKITEIFSENIENSISNNTITKNINQEFENISSIQNYKIYENNENNLLNSKILENSDNLNKINRLDNIDKLDNHINQSFNSISNSEISSDILQHHLKRPTSGKTSCISETSKSFLIFNSIIAIQNYKPLCLRRITYLMFFELLMIICFSVIIFNFYKEYVINNYDPIQRSFITYSKLATSLSYGTAMFTEMEYHSFNITTRKLSPLKQKLWIRIMNDNYEMMKNLNYQERNIENGLSYQKVYKNNIILQIDYQSYEVYRMEYSDCFDYYSKLYYSVIYDFNRSIPRNQQMIPQRNYPYTLPGASVIYLAVKADFFNSNSGTTRNIENLLVIFLVFNGVLKLIELWLLLKYWRILVIIIDIFKRVNLEDAIIEKEGYSEIEKLFKKPLMKINFIENRRNSSKKQDYSLATSNSKRAKSKKIKKSLFYNMKKLPQYKVYLFIFLLLLICFFYYYFNYYFWIINNVSISKLIQINTFFTDVYVYSTSIIGFNTLALRERIVRNPDYETINETYQKHSTRLTYLYASLIRRIYIIGNASAFYLPRYTIEAQKNIRNSEFEQLINRDNCIVLLNHNILPEEELSTCQQSFDGAFKNGILTLVNGFIGIIKSLDPLTKVYGINQTNETNQQRKDVMDYVNSQNYEDFLFSYYYYHNVVLIYYNSINDYYKGVMTEQMENLNIFLIITSVFCAAGFLGLGLGMKGKLERYYRLVALSLNIIPYEKIANDEQTKVLIGNFLKRI